jgi:hypothetical protein
MKFSFRKIKGFVFRYKYSIAAVLVSVIVAAGTLFYFLGRDVGFVAPDLKLKEKPKETRVAAPLTGELVDPSVIERTPMAVVIENHPDARPQSGYPDADLVFETLAEGGITRTLAIFHSKSPNEIGPVRSARPYFVEWAKSLDTTFAHVGGSADAISLISRLGVSDLNQFSFGSYFWRVNSRYAPHNVYTSVEKLIAAAKSAGYGLNKKPKEFSFKTDVSAESRPAEQNISISFSGPDFLVGYKYSKDANSYLRSVGGYPHKDSVSGSQLTVKNIVVLFTSIVPSRSSAGEQAVDIATTGTGIGYLFQDGKTINIKWSRSGNGYYKLTDASGVEVKFNPGQTWFEVVPSGNSVTY